MVRNVCIERMVYIYRIVCKVSLVCIETMVYHAGTDIIIHSVTSNFPYKDLGSGEFIDSLLV